MKPSYRYVLSYTCRMCKSIYEIKVPASQTETYDRIFDYGVPALPPDREFQIVKYHRCGESHSRWTDFIGVADFRGIVREEIEDSEDAHVT